MLVCALARAGEFERARNQLQALLKESPENTSFLLAAADLEVQAGNFAEAFRYFEIAHNLYPDYRPLVLNYSEALLQSGKPDRAKELLKQYGKYNTPDLTYYTYLTRAEEESGNAVEAGIANAEYYYLSGETRVAIERLKYILHQRDLAPDYYQEERIYARLDLYQQDLELERVMLKR